MIRLIVTSTILLLMIGSCLAQTYETRGIVTTGSGILENETYQSVVILGDPAATGDMVEEGGTSLTPGFLYVVEEPLKAVTGVTVDIGQLKLFPNPTGDILNISYDLNTSVQQLQVKIISMEGKEMITQDIRPDVGSNILQIYVRDLDQSLYLLTMTTGEASLSYQVRFIKN